MIDLFQDVKAMKEHKVDIEMTTIIDMAEEMIGKLREDIETLCSRYMKAVSRR